MKRDDFEEDLEDDYQEKSEEEFYDDEEDGLEEGFMKGYEKESNSIRCAHCRGLIEDDGVEEEFAGFNYKFCCPECLKEFEKRQK